MVLNTSERIVEGGVGLEGLDGEVSVLVELLLFEC
jgi:hypothetical protein